MDWAAQIDAIANHNYVPFDNDEAAVDVCVATHARREDFLAMTLQAMLKEA